MPSARLTYCESDYLGTPSRDRRTPGVGTGLGGWWVVVGGFCALESRQAQVTERAARGHECSESEQPRQRKAKCCFDVPRVGLDGAEGGEARHDEGHRQRTLDHGGDGEGGRMLA